uniref:Uncharacterized protein n=1 Tax=Rhizophora mucronata TaxID=61149 RepID=A0A2P2LUG3_RHIMU
MFAISLQFSVYFRRERFRFFLF